MSTLPSAANLALTAVRGPCQRLAHNTAIISSRSHTFFMSARRISLFSRFVSTHILCRVQTFPAPYPAVYDVIRSCGRRSFKSADKCPPTAAAAAAARPVRGGTLSLGARGRPRPDVCNKRARTRTLGDDKHEPAADVRSFGAIDSISFYYLYFLAPRKHDGEGDKKINIENNTGPRPSSRPRHASYPRQVLPRGRLMDDIRSGPIVVLTYLRRQRRLTFQNTGSV